MKIYLSVVICLFLPFVAGAREKGCYIAPAMDLGFTLSHNTTHEAGGFFGLYTGPTVQVNYMFNRYLGIVSGLGYRYYAYDIVRNENIKDHYTLYNQHVHYLSIPLMVHWEPGTHKVKNGWFWMDCGANFSMLLHAGYRIENIQLNTNNTISKGPKGENNADMKGFVVAARTGMGLGFSPGRKMDIIFGLNFEHSLTRTQKETHPVIPQEANRQFAASLKLGLQFRLGRY